MQLIMRQHYLQHRRRKEESLIELSPCWIFFFLREGEEEEEGVVPLGCSNYPALPPHLMID